MEDQEEAIITSYLNMDPARAAKICSNVRIASNIFLELLKQRHKGGVLTTIEILVPQT